MLKDFSTKQRTIMVAAAYRRIIKDIHNICVYVKEPQIGTQTYINFLNVAEMCDELNIGIMQYMIEAMAGFDIDYCTFKFGNSYPPLRMIISPTVYRKVRIGLQESVIGRDPKIVALRYFPAIKELSKDEAKKVVSAGYCGEASSVRDELYKLIEEKIK